MTVTLRTNWWALVLRGLAAIVLAVAAFALPGVTVAALVTLFGFYALIDGVLAIVSTVRAIEIHGRWGGFLLEGILGIGLGLLAIVAPLAIAAVFVTVAAVWAVFTGVLEIAAAIRLRRHLPGDWLLIAGGLFSIALGVTLFVWPLAGAVVLVWMFAIYGLLFGITLIALGMRLRRHSLRLAHPSSLA